MFMIAYVKHGSNLEGKSHAYKLCRAVALGGDADSVLVSSSLSVSSTVSDFPQSVADEISLGEDLAYLKSSISAQFGRIESMLTMLVKDRS